jgi:hypothetical protein
MTTAKPHFAREHPDIKEYSPAQVIAATRTSGPLGRVGDAVARDILEQLDLHGFMVVAKVPA